MMRSRRGHILILSTLLLLLAACTRQAEGPFQPVGSDQSTTVASSPSNTPDPALVPTEDSSVVVTNELLPTNDLIATDTGVATTDTSVITDPTATSEGGIVIFTLVATETFTPEGAVGLATETATLDPLATSEFITPGSSVDLMNADTATPEPGSTSELAATPTNMAEVDGTNEGGTPDATIEVDENCLYTVQRGDSLFQIALRNDTTVAELRAVNEAIQGTDVILPGDELFIPDCDVTPTPTVTRTALPAGELTHTVKAGESLYVIALQYGVTINDIIAVNELENPDRLFIGQVLIIPQEQ